MTGQQVSTGEILHRRIVLVQQTNARESSAYFSLELLGAGDNESENEHTDDVGEVVFFLFRIANYCPSWVFNLSVGTCSIMREAAVNGDGPVLCCIVQLLHAWPYVPPALKEKLSISTVRGTATQKNALIIQCNSEKVGS